MSPDAVAWSDWPARRTPRRAAVAAVVIVGTIGVVLVLDPLLAVVGAVMLLSATAEILLPSRYSLDADGVTIGRALWSRRQPWSKLQGWSPAPDGFVLQGAGSRALLRRRRTLRLRCPAQQVAVAAALHRHLG